MTIVDYNPAELLLLARLQIELLLRLGVIGDDYALGYRMSGGEFDEAVTMLNATRSRGEEIGVDTWLEVFYTLYDGDARKVHHVLGQAISSATTH